MTNTSITVAHGDGIGPEIMRAVLDILKHADAKIDIEEVEIGKKLYEKNFTSGINGAFWKSIEKNKILLKGPITTPQGGGYKSLNVTMRKTLGLYSNVRPCVAYHPYVNTNFPNMDLVIIRENEEDLYAGVEYRQTHNMTHAVKLISHTGSERIIRYAFDYAVRNNRKKVTCLTKDNIMKITDGSFHKIFDRVKLEYPQIESDHYIIDIGTARLASNPEIFDVIVTLNLYGDIISDVVAEISGSVGLAGSANIGSEYAMFEAIHGSAPTLESQNIANPSGLIHAAIMMLIHINQPSVAEKIHNAWLRTLEDGIHTKDIYNETISQKLVSTSEFAEEVIKRLDQKPIKMKSISYENNDNLKFDISKIEIDKTEKKELFGVDIFIDWVGELVDLAKELDKLSTDNLKLKLISCKGLKVWPQEEYSLNFGEGDHWRSRFTSAYSKNKINHHDINNLLDKLAKANFDFIKIENLYNFDDKPGFSLGQGE